MIMLWLLQVRYEILLIPQNVTQIEVRENGVTDLENVPSGKHTFIQSSNETGSCQCCTKLDFNRELAFISGRGFDILHPEEYCPEKPCHEVDIYNSLITSGNITNGDVIRLNGGNNYRRAFFNFSKDHGFYDTIWPATGGSKKQRLLH